ncbi:MAG TPA: thioesterase family protein [Pirellulaceae bacterium]|nr:thioesterase family protein [Pirellulaceae bacterium]
MPFTINRRVEFRDTDAAGIVHFSVFFNYMEAAEHELLRSLGTSVLTHDAEGEISWPRVAVACEYRGALRFEDEVEIQVSIERLGQKSVTYLFDFVKVGALIAHGKITAVCCRIEAGQPPRSITIPPAISEKLQALVA